MFLRARARAVIRILPLLLAAKVAGETLSLAGAWEWRADPRNAGLAAGWPTQPFTNPVVLPGIAPNPSNTATGALWLAREVEIPGHWQNRRIRLTLEGCPFASQLWVDGELAGACETAVGPHEYDLADRLFPGRHRLVLRLTQPLPGMPFLGIAGRLELATSPKAGITRLEVMPNARTKSVRVRVVTHNQFAGEGEGWAMIETEKLPTAAPRKPLQWRAQIPIGMGETASELVHSLGPAAVLWTPEQPALYRLKFWLGGTIVDRPVDDEVEMVFGLRSVRALATPTWLGLPLRQWQLNGQPVVLRSRDLPPHFAPRTHAPMELRAWREIFTRLQREGVGHLRFPGWCPPEAAFRAADELGLLLTPEVGVRSNPQIPLSPDFQRLESERLRRHFGHHPSLAF